MSLERPDYSGTALLFYHGSALISIRLHGHRDQITAIRFLYFPSNAASSSSDSASLNFLLTASKDTFLKLWNLSTQHCVQTIVAHSSEVWSLDVDPEQNLAFTGSAEGELKAWQINGRSVAEGFKENEKGEVSPCCIYVTAGFLDIGISYPEFWSLSRVSQCPRHTVSHKFHFTPMRLS